MSRLNGWQRLWVIVTVLWVLIVGAAAFTFNPDGYRIGLRDMERALIAADAAYDVDFARVIAEAISAARAERHIGERFLDFASAALLPPPCLYLLGLGLAWVRKGFREP